MDLKKYLLGMSVAERDDFAKRCNTSSAHLRNISYGDKSCGEDLAMAIDQESLGVITVEQLRPDLIDRWQYLRGTKKAA